MQKGVYEGKIWPADNRPVKVCGAVRTLSTRANNTGAPGSGYTLSINNPIARMPPNSTY